LHHLSHAGPPKEDIAFKIINREWNRSQTGFCKKFLSWECSVVFLPGLLEDKQVGLKARAVSNKKQESIPQKFSF
jgi:hypothetical protein